MADGFESNIPGPSGLPFVGNLFDVQDEIQAYTTSRLLDTYGPIVRTNVMGQGRIMAGSVELLEELCDEKRFWKATASSRNHGGVGRSGLFTSPSEDDMDWQLAHRILMPAFGPLAIHNMFGEMHDIASQLVLKWARLGSANPIDVTSDFTRLTLDTISLCAMEYRFNSFYQDELHPFVKAMTDTFAVTAQRNKVGTMVSRMMPWDHTREKVKLDRQYMLKVAMEMVQVRRDNPSDKKDLLNAMIKGKDPKTGESMDDELIGANMLTFLIAGHETTSSLLSFAMLQLMRHPDAYFKVQQEVDRVIGRGQMTADDLKDLKYINAVLRETLRINPAVGGFSRAIRKDNPNDVETLGGKYKIRRGEDVHCSIYKAHRDPKVYGDDALEFKPERMLDDNFNRLPKAAWKPFGSGMRACIGRAFAWQEAQMALALLFQNFNFRLSDPNYRLKMRQAPAMKPIGLYMHATLRSGIDPTKLHYSLAKSGDDLSAANDEEVSRVDSGPGDGEPMMILYGSNTGTCLALAQKLSVEASRHGFKAEVQELNAAVGVLPKEQPIAIITSSYEGQPPDNADQFIGWLESMPENNTLDGVSYTVFGCGHSDWRSTFQRIPTLVDDILMQRGAKRLADRGLSDAAKGTIFSDFDNWTDHTFWPTVAPDAEASNAPAAIMEAEMSTQNRSSYLRQDVQPAVVTEVKKLTADGEPEKRHLEIKLPEGLSYETGDYLSILPLNPSEHVERAMKYFKLTNDATINIKSGAATFLPTGVTISIRDLLQGFVELAQPATRKDIQACQIAASSNVDKAAIGIFVESEGYSEVVDQRVSLLHLLYQYPSIDFSFSTFISMLPPLRPRHYSIASSPLKDPNTCTITYGILNEVARSGIGRHIGVASAYMASLAPGDEVLVSVRATNKYFHMPADPEKTPILMFGAGTGIAPFRGFIEERAMQVTAGRKLAPAIMWMGCRSPSRDRLYGEEIDKWAELGAVDVRYAFSQDSAQSEGCKYVQDRVLRDREDLLSLWRQGAKAFICGSPGVSASCENAAKVIVKETLIAKGKEASEERVDEYFRTRRNKRFVVDVFD